MVVSSLKVFSDEWIDKGFFVCKFYQDDPSSDDDWQVILIDVLLAGDNAMVLGALAADMSPRDRKRVLARARDLITAPRPTPAPAPRSLYLDAACPAILTDRLPKTNQTPGGDPACTLSP